MLARAAGFSHSIVVPAGHDLVFLAGQTALDKTGVISGDGILAQFEQALHNVLDALEASGGTPNALVSMTVYVTDIEDYKTNSRQIGALWRDLIGRDYPAMAAVGVSRLWDIEALVELQAIAAIPPAGGRIHLA